MKSLFGRIALLAVVGGVLLLALRAWPSGRYQELRAQADDACRAYRHHRGNEQAKVCRFDAFDPTPPAPARERAADARIAAARTALAAGDLARAEVTLHDTLAEAVEAEHQGTLADAIVATYVTNRVLDVVAEHSELPAIVVRRIVGDARLVSADKPLERERIGRTWTLAHYGEQKLPGAPSFSERELAAEMERDDGALREMQRALVAGDGGACESAAKRLGPVSGPERVACPILEKVVRAGARLREARGS